MATPASPTPCRCASGRATAPSIPANSIPKPAPCRTGSNAAATYRAANSFRVRDPGPPSGPFVGSTQSWTDLGLKRALTEAARGNYDGMIWTPGVDQANRYGLAKHITDARLEDNTSGGIGPASLQGPFSGGMLKDLGAARRGPRPVRVQNKASLHGLIGKDLTDQLLAAPAARGRSGGLGVRARQLSGLDYRFGGEGMQGYYDNILPNRLKALTKKLDPERQDRHNGAARPGFRRPPLHSGAERHGRVGSP